MRVTLYIVPCLLSLNLEKFDFEKIKFFKFFSFTYTVIPIFVKNFTFLPKLEVFYNFDNAWVIKILNSSFLKIFNIKCLNFYSTQRYLSLIYVSEFKSKF